MDKSRIQPIILGTDILAYSYARSFHDLYGVTSICVSSVDMKYTSSSRYTDVSIVPDIDDDLCLMDNLVKLSHECSDRELIVLGSGDWYARYLSKHKDYLEGRSASTVINGEEYSKELGARYCVPYIGFELLDEITQKERFYEMCEEKGVDYPATCVFQCAPDKRVDHVSVPFNYPVIAKPSNSAEYHYVEFDGKQKIFSIDSEEELNRIYSNLCDSGYTHSLIGQRARRRLVALLADLLRRERRHQAVVSRSRHLAGPLPTGDRQSSVHQGLRARCERADRGHRLAGSAAARRTAV